MIIGRVKYSVHILLTVGTAILGAAFFTTTTRSIDRVPLSEEHIGRIVANCTSAKASLQQLHRSDASLRVNRGQLYESISTKLMARLNSRIALNRLDGSDLVSAAAQYEQGVARFRSSYQVYEEQLTALLRINCQKQPEEFYYQTLEVRALRQAVAASVAEVNNNSLEYYKLFGQFSEHFRAGPDVEAEQ